MYECGVFIQMHTAVTEMAPPEATFSHVYVNIYDIKDPQGNHTALLI